ncbi:hypothetical protein BHE74_00027861 [Ensete ventricosum]|nr:hypothetical protein BHE74_00027861 [Ensete ventricosum]
MSRLPSDGGIGVATGGPSLANGMLANGDSGHRTCESDLRGLDRPGVAGAAAAPLPPRPSSPSTLPASIRRTPEEEWRGLRRCVEAATKGFAIGAGLKGGLALFSVLVRLKRRRSLSPSARKAGVFTNEEAVVLALKETLRYGLFLGTFAGSYVSVDEVIAAFDKQKFCFLFCLRTAGWRSLIAGLIAGPSMLLTGPTTQHTSLAIYILMRAAVLASRCGIKSERFGGVCRPLTWLHGDIFLMCLASSQILYV